MNEGSRVCRDGSSMEEYVCTIASWSLGGGRRRLGSWGPVLAKHARCRAVGGCGSVSALYSMRLGSWIRMDVCVRCTYTRPRFFRSARSRAMYETSRRTYPVQMKSNAPVAHASAIVGPKLVRAEMSIRWWGHVRATALLVHTPDAK